MYVLEKLCLSITYTAVGPESIVNELHVYGQWWGRDMSLNRTDVHLKGYILIG